MDTSYQPVISSSSSSSSGSDEGGDAEQSAPAADVEEDKAATKAWILQQYGAEDSGEEEDAQVRKH